jgi:hypothetical protein
MYCGHVAACARLPHTHEQCVICRGDCSQWAGFPSSDRQWLHTSPHSFQDVWASAQPPCVALNRASSSHSSHSIWLHHITSPTVVLHRITSLFLVFPSCQCFVWFFTDHFSSSSPLRSSLQSSPGVLSLHMHTLFTITHALTLTRAPGCAQRSTHTSLASSVLFVSLARLSRIDSCGSCCEV